MKRKKIVNANSCNESERSNGKDIVADSIDCVDKGRMEKVYCISSCCCDCCC